MQNNNKQKLEDRRKPNSQILACVDGSSVSEAVCDYAIWVASILNQPLCFLHTIEHKPEPAVADLSGAIGLGSSEELLEELASVEQQRNSLLIKKGSLMLQAAKQKAESAGLDKVHIQQRHGSLIEALVDLEDRIGMLIIGIRGEQHDQERLTKEQQGIGTQLETVVRALHRPILVINKTFAQPKNIMLAYDGSAAADKALELVANSPLTKDILCHLVHVTEDGQSDVQLLERAADQLISAGVKVKGIGLEGKIETVLTNYQAQENIDLMVMGAFSHNRIRDFLLGSFTANMLASTQRPLLLLR